VDLLLFLLLVFNFPRDNTCTSGLIWIRHLVKSYLAAADFSAAASVLVVKQYDPTAPRDSFMIEEGTYDEVMKIQMY
jgi:hypothetical protein